MNASNHLRPVISSLKRERKGLGSAITAKDRLQCLFGVEYGWRRAGSAWAPIDPTRPVCLVIAWLHPVSTTSSAASLTILLDWFRLLLKVLLVGTSGLGLLSYSELVSPLLFIRTCSLV